MESYLDISSKMSVIGRYVGGTEKRTHKKHFTIEKHDAEAGGKNSAARLPGAEPFLLSSPFSHDFPCLQPPRALAQWEANPRASRRLLATPSEPLSRDHP